MKPYAETVKQKNKIIRKFEINVSQDELVWHRDKQDRNIKVLFGEGWKFQKDNMLPFNINIDDTFSIEKMEYHRLIKGDTDLFLEITL